MADVTIQVDGSIAVFTPWSEAAREWTEDNVEIPAWAWIGGGFACEARFAPDLREGYLAAGFGVEIISS